MGWKLGMDIPKDSTIKIIAIQAEEVQTLGEKLTPGVEISDPPSGGSRMGCMGRRKGMGTK